MTEDQKMNKNFIKVFKLPIAVDKEPYFSYFLNLLNPYFDTIRKYGVYKKAYAQHGESLFQHNSSVLNETLQYLKKKAEFEQFSTMDMSRFNKKLNVKSKDLYTTGNENKRYISIDLVKANFQSFLYTVPSIFDGFTDFDSFAKSRNFNDVLMESKITRQVIFGNLNSPRQQQIQKFMMEQIINELSKHGFDKNNVYSLSSDEVFFEDNGSSSEEIAACIKNIGLNVRVEIFDLIKPFEKAYFVKKGLEGKVDFKMVIPANMAEFIKKYEGRELEDMDFYFYDENKRLAKFMEEGIF